MNFVWRKEWLHAFESPWGVFERFKFANHTVTADIIRIFGTAEAIAHPLRTSSRNLITLDGLSPEKMKLIFGASLKEYIEPFWQQFIHPLGHGLNDYRYFRKDLGFCPECLKLGYHSLFHQYTLLESCPFHGTTLLFRCPNCRQTIPFELNFAFFQIPFCCKCGYSFSSHGGRRKFLERWSQSPLRYHKRCIQQYTKNRLSLLQVCPYAVAYARWKQEIESQPEPWRVENGRYFINSGRTSSIPGFFSWTYNPLLQELIDRNLVDSAWHGRDAAHRKLWPGIAWVCSRVFCHLLVRRFNEWVDFVVQKYPRTHAERAIGLPNLKLTLPFIVVESKYNSVGQLLPLQIQWWLDSVDQINYHMEKIDSNHLRLWRKFVRQRRHSNRKLH